MINDSASDNLHWNTMNPKTRQTFTVLASLPVPDEFYLAGGTALALQIGHRTSFDLDFFSSENQLDIAERAVLSHTLQRLESVVIKTVHLAYALSYFDDAETDPYQLNMIQNVNWEDVKAYCLEGARLLSKINAGLEPPA